MDTIVTEYTDYCVFCGKQKKHDHHLVYGRGIRPIADEDGLKVPICNACHAEIHNNGIAGKLSKMLGQAVYEGNIGDREDFRRRYGRSYL